MYVATEPLTQAEVAVKALTSGKHCICVKPPSVSMGEVEKMLKLSHYYSQLHSVLECHMEFVPAFMKLKEMIHDGKIGELLTVDVNLEMGSLIGEDAYSWKCDPTLGGGVLNLIGSHIIGAICNVRTSFCQVKKVNCMLKTFQKTTQKINGYRNILSDDYCCIQLEFTNGMFANILINSLCRAHYSYQMSANGSNGRLIIRGLDLYLQEKDSEEKLVYKEDISSENRQRADEANRMNIPFELYYSTLIGCQGMVASLRELFSENGSSDPLRKSDLGLSSFEDGYHIRTVLDLARFSSSHCRWVDVPSADHRATPSNPFWTSSGVKIDADKPSPKAHDPVTYV